MKYDEDDIIRQLSDPKTQRKAFETVVRQYSEPLYWHIRRIVVTHDDANDVLQNVFIKAWSNLGSFRHDSKLSTWLYRIAVNESIDFQRRQKNIVSVSADDVDSGVANHLMADRFFDGNKASAMLEEAIQTLPDVQKNVFCLRYYNEMKYSEMSKVMKTTEGALKASYHIAVKKIAEFLKSND